MSYTESSEFTVLEGRHCHLELTAEMEPLTARWWVPSVWPQAPSPATGELPPCPGGRYTVTSCPAVKQEGERDKKNKLQLPGRVSVNVRKLRERT